MKNIGWNELDGGSMAFMCGISQIKKMWISCIVHKKRCRYYVSYCKIISVGNYINTIYFFFFEELKILYKRALKTSYKEVTLAIYDSF